MRRLIFLTFLLLFLSTEAKAVTVYVNPFTTPSAGHAGTIGDPYQTWTEPCAALAGIGGLININTGVAFGFPIYTLGSGSVVCSGISSNPIIFRGNISVPTNTPGANAGAPVLNNTNSGNLNGRQIQIRYNTAYVEFQNLIITGSVANQSCFFYETNSGTGQFNHHITEDHLTLSNCGCDSLYAQGGDYYTITNNVATNNGASCSSASVSAVHIYQPINFDNLPGTHILVANNELSGESKGTGPQSDGNGIQVPDDGNGTQGGWCANWSASQCPYSSQVVIQNNFVNGNDGDGYSYFSSSNPTLLVNNNFYQNVTNQVSNSVWGEVVWNTAPGATTGSLQSYNNIVSSRTSAYKCHIAEGSGTAFVVVANANDNFTCSAPFSAGGSGSFSAGAANVTGNPNFVSPPTNFNLTAPSAAIGTANGAFAPSTNIFNNSRTGSGGVCTAVGSPNMGAI